MSIERDSTIRFHESGTKISITRWIKNHDEGIAAWLKNTRRAIGGMVAWSSLGVA